MIFAPTVNVSPSGIGLMGRLQSIKFKTRTHVSHSIVRGLQYADDTTLVYSNAEELEQELDIQSVANAKTRLRVNLMKTEVIHGSVEADPLPVTLKARLFGVGEEVNVHNNLGIH